MMLLMAKETAAVNLKSFFNQEDREVPTKGSSSVVSKQKEGPIKDSVEPEATLSKHVLKNSVLDAEIIWAMKCVKNNFSYNSCKDISNVFQKMFTDSAIAKQFTCGPTKCAYMVSFGVAPHFINLLQDKIKNVDSFTLCFDEALNKALQMKQMDLHIRYWDDVNNQVETRYLSSAFLGHSTAEDAMKAFRDLTNKLDLNKLIQISMDGPAVNWKLFGMIQGKLNQELSKQVLNLGSCGLHVMNNAFKKGNQVAGWNLDALFSALYWLFKDSPSRREDFLNISTSKKMPYKFCSHRWLENIPAAERTLEIWEDVKHFVSCVEKKQFTKPGSKSYETVGKSTKDNLICVKLNFFLSVARMLTPFLEKYQSSNPMLPFFAEDLRRLILDLISNFNVIKKECTDKLTSANKLSKLDLEDKSMYTQIHKISLGFLGNMLAKNLLFEKKVSEKDILDLRSDAQMFLISLLKTLLEKSPVISPLVRSLSSLDPRQMALNCFDCYTKMKLVLTNLMKAKVVKEDECEGLLIDYNKFLSEQVSSNYDLFKLFNPSEERLDTFLDKFLSEKFSKLYGVIKKFLILSDGQADVERGFSSNKLIKVENLKCETFIAQRVIIDHLKHTGD